jgi:hypothetical protein
MIKKVVLELGEALMGFFFILALIGVFLMGIIGSADAHSFGKGLLTFVIIELWGFSSVLISFFLIYLLIDIRDTLKRIEENTRKNSQYRF